MELQNTYRNFSSSFRFSVFVWMAENDSNTLSVDGYVIYFFLVNGERDLRFQKSQYIWTRPKIQIFFFVVLSRHKCYRRLAFTYLPNVITTM